MAGSRGFSPLASFLFSHPELTSGEHMKYIGSDLLALSNENVGKAQIYATTIMNSSSTRDLNLENTALSLVNLSGKRQRGLAAALVRYRNLTESTEQDELPDNFDLLGDGALNVLVGMATESKGEYENINDITDSVMRMGRAEQSKIGEALLQGISAPGMISHFFPLGVEIF